MFVVVVTLAGCGGTGGGGSQVKLGRGDSATFVIDGRSVSVTESGRTSVTISGAPELTYSGPVGCAGRYFTTHFVDGVPMLFRYGSEDAYLLIGSDLYHLGGRPARSGGGLTWDTTTDGHQIAIRLGCPEPPNTGPLVAYSTPPACSVLTRAVAAAALGKKVGEPRFIPENPDLTYCEYRSGSADGRLSVGVGTADEIKRVSSWSDQPAIPGLGDEAHGGDASLGLAVVRGKLGVEVTADLGFSADDAKNLAVEQRVASALLAQLPG
jgi:hypothetical protein